MIHATFVNDQPDEDISSQTTTLLQEQLRREELRQHHAWKAGDLLVFDNRRFLHGRNMFQGFGRKLDHLRIQ